MKNKMRKRTQKATATAEFWVGFFSFSSLLPYLKKHYIFWHLHWRYHGKKILQWGMFCWTLAQTTFSSVSRRRQGYLLTSTLPLLPHFSSVSSCPTSHADDPPGSPFHCPHLNFLASQQLAQGRAPALNNACTVPHIRQYYFLFWFITNKILFWFITKTNIQYLPFSISSKLCWVLWLDEVTDLTKFWVKWVSRSRWSTSGAEKVCKNLKNWTNPSTNTPHPPQEKKKKPNNKQQNPNQTKIPIMEFFLSIGIH